MKILLAMGLADRSLGNYIGPLTTLPEAEEVTVVRDTEGPPLKKVTYVVAGTGLPGFFRVFVKLWRMVRLARAGQPHLVHGFLLYPHGYLALIAGKITGRKTGLSLIAGPVETYVFGGSPIGSYSYCNPLPRPGIVGTIVLAAVRRFDVITVTGTYTKKYLQGCGVDPKKIFILPHVVDGRFRPMELRKDYDLVFVGRLAAVKHVETVLYAVALAKPALPAIRVAIVGDGAERGRLESMARSLGIAGNVDFAGFRQDTWEWYNRSRLSIVTSEREGFPYTVIESLRCGTPVITSDCGDVRDIMADGHNGRIVPNYNDPRAFADVIVGLLNDPHTIQQYAEYCRSNPPGGSPEQVWAAILALVSP